jgi:serine/threonine protein kinase
MADLVDVRERYQLLAKLGSGGMADVFLAVQLGVEDFKRLVVLKRIHSHWLGQRDSFKMFIDEAQLVATLNHPHIVKIYDLTWMGSDVCIAMEYVDGESLAFVIRSLREQGERIPLPVVFKIVTEACDALSYVHAATMQDGEPLNLVHRDICPQNLLLDSNGYIKVIDFGIARSIGSNVDNTSPGVLKGKLP